MLAASFDDKTSALDACKSGSLMRNDEIAEILDEIADMLELRDDNFYHKRAYRLAAEGVRDFPQPIELLPRDQLQKIRGIGPNLASKLATLLETGELPLLKELREKFPRALLELKSIPGLGANRIKLLAELLNIRSRADLKRAVDSGSLAGLKGFGPKMQERLRKSLAIETGPSKGETRRALYGEAAPIAGRLISHLRRHPYVERAEVAGSFRRRADTVGDLKLLAASAEPESVKRHFLDFPGIVHAIRPGASSDASVIVSGGLRVELHVVAPQNWSAALIWFTGSKSHCAQLQSVARARGLRFDGPALLRDGASMATRTEEEVYRALDLFWIPPELREARGEFEAAEHRLPALLELADLRGDLHTHSTWTDGRASIEQMARSAEKHRLEYFALTDHSQRLKMVNGLDPARLRDQWREIDSVRERVPGVKLLRGIEVDILEDGELDLPQDVLAELDWVVASVHSKLDQEPAAMTERLLRAIRNPMVDVIGHPTGRLIGRRNPSNFDLDAVLRAASQEGCALEVNSQVDRLDLRDEFCREAKRAGVKLVISTDAHRHTGFSLLVNGVNQARRGWIEANDVLNTRPLAKLRQGRKLRE
jgi:DNA polymerase (family X)